MRPRLSIFSASLVLALTVSDLDFVMMMTAARYSPPEQGLAAMDLRANISIPAMRAAHWKFSRVSSREPRLHLAR